MNENGTAGAGGDAPASGDSGPPLYPIEEFVKWDLRVARIVSAEAHPRADRLLKLRVDVGDGERPLVAGIAAAYKPEELVGRTIIVVANLKPATLRGEESRGMLLAAAAGDAISLLMPDRDLPPGSKVK